jgi:hypothetical protein
LPGELHKLWRCREPGTYHVEYGYSCMGYEIAGTLGVKLALPEREIWVLVGDGSYLMMNSEIATSVILGKKLNIVLLNNGGFGCIDRLQRACGGASFNNLFANGSGVDFAAHAASLGATARKVASLAELEAAECAVDQQRSLSGRRECDRNAPRLRGFRDRGTPPSGSDSSHYPANGSVARWRDRRTGIRCVTRRTQLRSAMIRCLTAGIGRSARRWGDVGHRVAVGGHALPIHDVVLRLQRLLRIRCANRVANDAEGAARGRANRNPFAGVACGRADPGTKRRSERCAQ